MTHNPAQKQLIFDLYECGAFNFGKIWTLKSGLKSPFYVDMRHVIAEKPSFVARLLECFGGSKIDFTSFDTFIGVPTSGTPLASCAAITFHKRYMYGRENEKAHGTGHNIIGGQKGAICALIEDVVTSGESVCAFANKLLAQEQVQIKYIIIFMDRQQGAVQLLKDRFGEEKIVVFMDITMVVDILLEAGKISQENHDTVLAFIENNDFV